MSPAPASPSPAASPSCKHASPRRRQAQRGDGHLDPACKEITSQAAASIHVAWPEVRIGFTPLHRLRPGNRLAKLTGALRVPSRHSWPATVRSVLCPGDAALLLVITKYREHDFEVRSPVCGRHRFRHEMPHAVARLQHVLSPADGWPHGTGCHVLDRPEGGKPIDGMWGHQLRSPISGAREGHWRELRRPGTHCRVGGAVSHMGTPGRKAGPQAGPAGRNAVRPGRQRHRWERLT
jgi:hypothetical protein